MPRRIVLAAAVAAALLSAASPASAAGWLPHPADATWTYQWSDSVYNPTPTKEKVTVSDQKGGAFTLAWTTDGLDNPADAPSSKGTVSFQDTTGGLVNTNWSSDPPPSNFPILCTVSSPCGNSLASSFYLLIWGTRAPVLPEPLLQGTSWASTGGFQNDVAASSFYEGTEKVTVPAFPQGVVAAKVRSDVTQAGALGDPYGSGVRTVWWVYGVGPVKIVFQHNGGSGAPVSTSELLSTNQSAEPPPPDVNWFPLVKGAAATYSWTNAKHLKQPVMQRFTVDGIVNGSAQVSAATITGPIRATGAYGFTLRTDGLSSIWASTKAASLAKLPPLGPKALPADKRRHFFTAYDLLTYGFGPVLTAYPKAGDTWYGSKTSRDYAVYGVTGRTRVLGVRTVKVPAGTFRALEVQSSFTQPGFPFGSGSRTMWFASGRGLVKLVFRHGDRSVSVVELLK